MRTKPGATRVGGLQPSNQRAVQGIAKNRKLPRPIGARLETTLQYQQDLGVGAGTVQKALRLVESVGAARLRQAGHRGTFIEEHDLGLLWNLADLDHVRIALTPPGALEQYGLAAGLTEEFGRVDVPISQHFARGGERRLALLAQSETDVAVVSRGAAQAFLMGNTEWQFFELGPHSYYSEDSLLVVSLQRARRGRGSAPKRVGIDRTSRDHEQLTLAEFPARRRLRIRRLRIPADPCRSSRRQDRHRGLASDAATGRPRSHGAGHPPDAVDPREQPAHAHLIGGAGVPC